MFTTLVPIPALQPSYMAVLHTCRESAKAMVSMGYSSATTCCSYTSSASISSRVVTAVPSTRASNFSLR